MRGLFLALLAIFLVGGDASTEPHQLMHNARHANEPEALLWQAARQGSEEAQSLLVQQAVVRQSQYWLEKLVSLGNAEAAWELYKVVGDESTTDRLMELAAIGNVPEAQMEFALSTDAANKRETWLRRSAKQGYLPAQAALADWYILHQQVDKARPWLEQTAEHYAESAFQLGRLLWGQGEQAEGREYIQRAAQQGHALAMEYADILNRYQPRSLQGLWAADWPAVNLCHQRIQFFATSLSAIERADTLYQSLVDDPRLANLPLCAQPPIWAARDAIECDKNWQQSGRMGCDVRALADAVSQRQFTHAIVVMDQGKAYIDNGVMYLDITDTYSVLVHELAHFSGFVDEYPLSQGLAERYCQRRNAPNLIFDGALTYEPVETLQSWQRLQPHTGIWPAKTCDNWPVQAYKPSGRVTFMEHHDSGEIPPLYLRLWRQRLAEYDTHTPIYLNLFQSYHRHRQTAQAGLWLQKYEGYQSVGLGEASASQ